jgi:hypothetical protein
MPVSGSSPRMLISLLRAISAYDLRYCGLTARETRNFGALASKVMISQDNRLGSGGLRRLSGRHLPHPYRQAANQALYSKMDCKVPWEISGW